MKYNKDKREIALDKELNNLDKFVWNFVKLLNDYVVVSEYVSILLGRSRSTEDIDLLIPPMSHEKFKNLQKSAEERLKFIDFWVNYIKTHSDKEQGSQQKELIDSQISE